MWLIRCSFEFKYENSFPFKTQRILQGKLSDTIKCDFVVSYVLEYTSVSGLIIEIK